MMWVSEPKRGVGAEMFGDDWVVSVHDWNLCEKEKGRGDNRPETARLARLRAALQKQHVSSVTGVRCISARQQRWCQYARETQRWKATAFIRNLPSRYLLPTRGGGKKAS